MSRPLRGRPGDLKRGEGRGGARQYFKNVGEGGREGGERARAPLERPISNTPSFLSTLQLQTKIRT